MLETKNRSLRKEWIDLGNYSHQEYEHCLRELGNVGKILGGDRACLFAFDQLKPKPSSILDVGCGGGYFTKKLAEHFPKAHVLGMDISKAGIEHAKEHHQLSNLRFEWNPSKGLAFEKKSIDVVTATLVCHHMTDEEIIAFLKEAKEVAKKAIIINDLHRNWMAYTGFAMVAIPLFRSRLMVHDGLVSVLRSFVKKDWARYLDQAGFKAHQWQIHWKWAFRWIITIRP